LRFDARTHVFTIPILSHPHPHRSRDQARERARAHKRAGNMVAANECYQRAVDVSPEMAKAVIDRLKRDGFECVVAPYEADGQMAYLVRHGFVDAVITEAGLLYSC
jgi:exonuclease-1